MGGRHYTGHTWGTTLRASTSVTLKLSQYEKHNVLGLWTQLTEHEISSSKTTQISTSTANMTSPNTTTSPSTITSSTTTSGGRNKSKNWSRREDEQLCRSYLAVTNDAAFKADPYLVTFWDRVKEHYFAANGGEDPNGRRHQQRSFDSRWTLILAAFKKYVGFLAEVKKSRTSPEQEEINALEMHVNSTRKEFRHMHCYRILCRCPKFMATVEAKRTKKGGRSGADTNVTGSDSSVAFSVAPSIGPSANDSCALILANTDGTPEPFTRPPGRQPEKAQSAGATGEDCQEKGKDCQKKAKIAKKEAKVAKKKAKGEEFALFWSVMTFDSTTIADPARRAWVEEYQARILANKNRFLDEDEEENADNSDSIQDSSPE